MLLHSLLCILPLAGALRVAPPSPNVPRRIQYLFENTAGLADRVYVFRFLNGLGAFHGANVHIIGGSRNARLYLTDVHSSAIAEDWSEYFDTRANNGNPFHEADLSLPCRNASEPSTDWFRIFDGGVSCVNIYSNFYSFQPEKVSAIEHAFSGIPHEPVLSHTAKRAASVALEGMAVFGYMHIRRCDRLPTNRECTDPSNIRAVIGNSTLFTWVVFSYAEEGYLPALKRELSSLPKDIVYEEELFLKVSATFKGDNYLRYAASLEVQNRASEVVDLHHCSGTLTSLSLQDRAVQDDSWVGQQAGLCGGREDLITPYRPL